MGFQPFVGLPRILDVFVSEFSNESTSNATTSKFVFWVEF